MKKQGKNLSMRKLMYATKYKHCPPAKRRGDSKPKNHEEQRKDVA
jgi:hypothetical protein